MKSIFKVFSITVAIVALACESLAAQSASGGTYGFYSPYSAYGIGDLSMEGTAYNHTLGGTGIATRNKRYVSFTNPASITCRDSLSFLADFSVESVNSMYLQNGQKSAKNTFNMHSIAMTFPIWRSSAFVVGFTPFSNMGYDFSSKIEDQSIIGQTGIVENTASGQGSLNDIFIAAAATFWNRLSVGAQFSYLFGKYSKYSRLIYSSTSYSSDYSGYEYFLSAYTGKFGLQYEEHFGKNFSMIIGATYRLSTKLRGDCEDYLMGYHSATVLIDTLRYEKIDLAKENLRIGDELGVGISVNIADKVNVEFNYLRGHWSNSGFDSFDAFKVESKEVKYQAGTMQSFRLGFEYVPNRNDVRYYHKRMSYRAGGYFTQSPYRVNGGPTINYGVTLGLTFPVFRWYNGVSIGIDFGRYELPGSNLVSQNYVKFVLGFNLHDYWFHKSQYN